MSQGTSHTPFDVPTLEGWTLYVAHSEQVNRLVVFVHGFNGRSVKTWLNFPEAGDHREWWRDADLLFIGYKSLRENITGVANRVRRELPLFYPDPFGMAMNIAGARPRENISPYSELTLVGHSLGGLILRRAMVDGMMKWRDAGSPDPRPAWLTGRLRLFSPASAGFQSAGFLGAVNASGIWGAIEMFLNTSSAYRDLQPGSAIQTDTRLRTEALASQNGGDTLRANIVWANPDEVVITERYTTDFVDDSWDGKSHTTICKPELGDFEMPWSFVETGSVS